MIIKVIPLDISFDNNEGLSYFVQDSLKDMINIWGIVEFPIKNKLFSGVITSIWDETYENEIKSISNVICSFPLISKYQINMIFALSKRYFLPLHKVLNLFLPKYIYNMLEKKSFEDVSDIEIFPEDLTRSWSINVFHLINEDLYSYLSKTLTNDTVYIMSDDFAIDAFMNNYIKDKGKIIAFKNSFTYTKKYKTFISILKKEKNILIWTRKILQYNLARFKRICFTEDFLVNNIYNQSEKYKCLDLLKLMAKNHNFNIDIVTDIPSIELINMIKKNNLNYATI